MVLRSLQESFKVSEVISDSHFAFLQSLSSAASTAVMTDVWSADRNGLMPQKAAKRFEHQIKMLASQSASADKNWGLEQPDQSTSLGDRRNCVQGCPRRIHLQTELASSTVLNSGPRTFFVTCWTNCHPCLDVAEISTGQSRQLAGSWGQLMLNQPLLSSQVLVFLQIHSRSTHDTWPSTHTLDSTYDTFNNNWHLPKAHHLHQQDLPSDDFLQ
jgi:hypothetical protein